MPNDHRTEIVLVGGGHAHVQVMKVFGARLEPRIRVSLITRDLVTPYSGMLPGVVAGLYRADQAHIDLVRLAAATKTHLVHAEAIGLDRANKRVLLAGREPLPYDLVSLNVGVTPALDAISGAAEHGIAVKPIGSFLAKLDTLRACYRASGGPRRIAVIGGGASGVELLLSVQTRLIAEANDAGIAPDEFAFALFTAGELLQSHNRRVQATFRHIFAARGIDLHEQCAIVAVRPGAVTSASGEEIAADAVLIATGAAAPAWLRTTGLTCDADGFVAVRPTLQALDDPDVFAAGDCAALVATPRDKAGVFAVRAGPPLARNLRLRARRAQPQAWRPQCQHLALISAGERYAVASRGPFKIEGGWVWRVKDLIDRRWIRGYQRLRTAV
jgi:selenide,water dikinase